MHLFMTRVGIEQSTPFSDHVWGHDGLDIIAVAILLVTFSMMRITRLPLGAAALICLLPTVAMFNSLAFTPFWSALFLVPAVSLIAFAVWGAVLAREAPAS